MIALSTATLAAVSLFAIAQAASQPAQPQGGARATVRDVSAELTMIFEVGEHQLNVQESWVLRNRASSPVPPAELSIPLPAGAKFGRVDEKIHGFKMSEALNSIEASEPLPTGDRELTEGYILDLSGSTADLARPIPFAVEHARVIIQDLPGVSVATSIHAERRSRDLNGRTFAIYEMGNIPMGTSFSLTITGLPSHTAWPRRIALVIVAGILGWMAWALKTKHVPGAEHQHEPIVGPLSPRARRDQLVKAVEVLEQDFKDEKVKEKRFQRRHAELMKELASVLKEIELEREASKIERTGELGAGH